MNFTILIIVPAEAGGREIIWTIITRTLMNRTVVRVPIVRAAVPVPTARAVQVLILRDRTSMVRAALKDRTLTARAVLNRPRRPRGRTARGREPRTVGRTLTISKALTSRLLISKIRISRVLTDRAVTSNPSIRDIKVISPISITVRWKNLCR